MIKFIAFLCITLFSCLMSMDDAQELVRLSSFAPAIKGNVQYNGTRVPAYLHREVVDSIANVQHKFGKIGSAMHLVVIQAYVPASLMRKKSKNKRIRYELSDEARSFAQGMAVSCYFVDLKSLKGLTRTESEALVLSEFPPFNIPAEKKKLSEVQLANLTLLTNLFAVEGWLQGSVWHHFIYCSKRSSAFPKPLDVSFEDLKALPKILDAKLDARLKEYVNQESKT